MVWHDFIIVTQEKSNSILKTNTENIGIVKEWGLGYYSDNGNYIQNIKIHMGQRVLFTQHMDFEIDGEKVYVVRGRDVIKSWDVDTTPSGQDSSK